MRSAIVLIFGLLFLLPPQVVLAEDLIRVEVLVFKHGNGQADRWPVDQLDDFSALLDPRERARLASWSARPPGLTEPSTDADADRQASASPTATALSAGAHDGRSPEWPLRFVHDDQLSTNMQRALDRLRASANHEVLSVTSWLQPLDRRRTSPAVRIRDDRPIQVDWQRPTNTALGFAGALAAPEQMPPSIYRLDGSVRIRQRQFRHAELNLVWAESRAQAAPGAFASTSEFEVHRLRQSRPIQFGRIEYFDSPWIGALILVETWRAPHTDGD
ncbi:MAG: CsiV family protein [Wenzhouxiangella sp.]